MNKPELPANVKPLAWVGPDDPAYEQSGLIHCAHIPAKATLSQPVPVVVMLHGWAGDESSMWTFKQALPAGTAVITPRAPFDLDNGGFVWFFYEGERLRPARASLEEALSRLDFFLRGLSFLYPVNPDRILLMGFSQGAAMINTFVLIHPGTALAVASLAGAIPTPANHNPEAKGLTSLSVFIAHGTQDDVVPLPAARESRDLFQAMGANVTYGEYLTGHKVNSLGMQDLKCWIAETL